MKDDYELYLQEQGYAGQEATHAMGHNDYIVRPWHLPEHLHQTNWTVHQDVEVHRPARSLLNRGSGTCRSASLTLP